MLTRRTMLTSGLSLPLLPAIPAFGCDDPPNHYEAPCQAAFPSVSGYYPIAQSQNYFAENGVTIGIRPLSFAELQEAIDTAHVAQIFGPVALSRDLVSAEIQIFATPVIKVKYTLWGDASKLQQADDYRQTRIAVGAPEFGYSLAMINLAQNFGLDPSELETVYVPPSSERIQANAAGAVDAAWFTGSYDEHVEAFGFDKLYQTEFPFAPHVFVAPKGELEQERNLSFYSGFLRAISQSVAFLHENPGDSVEIISKVTRLDEEAARIVYAGYAQSEVAPTLDVEALENVKASLIHAFPDRTKEFEQIKIDALVNPEIVKFSL